MKITYIHHSCFAIELENEIAIIFDYFKDDKNIINQIIAGNSKIYVLSSHRHPDHFSTDVFQWRATGKEIHYIFSADINKRLKNRNCDSTVRFIKEGEMIIDSNIKFKAFGSTDIGISLMVEVGGLKIFHAGDLNNWHWSEESTADEIEKANKDFLGKLKAIKKYTNDIDIAMFPVDPRMGGDFAQGARQLVNAIKIRYFIPMHFWEYADKACQFHLYKNENYGEYISLNKEGATIEI